jgi:hypothetical protein
MLPLVAKLLHTTTMGSY